MAKGKSKTLQCRSMKVPVLLSAVDKDIAAIKRSRDWEAKFMLLKEMMDDERNAGKAEGLSEGSFLEKQNIIRRLLARNMPDADILELADCEQSLIDEVRKALAPS